MPNAVTPLAPGEGRVAAFDEQVGLGEILVADGSVVPGRNEEYLLYQILLGAWPAEEPDDEAMAVRRLGFYARCGAVDTGWTEHLFDAWFRVLVLPAEGETLDAETANKELADCYSRVMGADKWRRYVRLYRPDGTEEKF